MLNKAQDIAKKKAAKSAENLAKQLAAAKRAKQAEERTHAIKQSVMGFKDKDDIAYKYALQFFDKNVLKDLDKRKNIVQMWSMLPFDIELKSGFFMNESCLIHSWDGDMNYKGKPDLNLSNHMTAEQNKNWAKKVYDCMQKNRYYQSSNR